MKAPISWIREYAEFPTDVTGRDLAAKLIDRGLEVETVYTLANVQGPLVVGLIEEIEELTDFKKPIRFCKVNVGSEHGANGTEIREIICGATNFSVGDLIVAALPGAELPGGFKIASRKTYDHISDGMICSERELGLGEDHNGIMILPVDSGQPGDDAKALLGLDEEILDIAVTPDRGYALSIRGLAREAANAYGGEFREPVSSVPVTRPADTEQSGDAVACSSDNVERCDYFTTRTLTGVDAKAETPLWMRQRLTAAGMRPISILVDIANYVMIETGQPLHTFDRAKLNGDLVARDAKAGETLKTLDDQDRQLDADDLVIADDSGPIALAGTMGGASTEIDFDSTALVIEAAHFAPEVVGRMARRHKLPSEASRRFERGVDDLVCPAASERASELIRQLAGGEEVGFASFATDRVPIEIQFDINYPSTLSGLEIGPEQVVLALTEVGCVLSPELESATTQDASGTVVPPSWRPDLTDPADLVEEVLRIVGFDNIPSRLPHVPSGRGLTASQQLRRRAAKVLAANGLIETLTYPFIGQAELEQAGIASQPELATLVTLANPLSAEQPGLRTTLIPGLLAAARLNTSRGADSVAIYETGLVFIPGSDSPNVPRIGVDSRPSDDDIESLQALLPAQGRHAAGVLAGSITNHGWWGSYRNFDWSDAISVVRNLAAELAVDLQVEQGEAPMFHPGRTAALLTKDKTVGHAGELHPQVSQNFGLPLGSAAFEVDLDALVDASEPMRGAPTVSSMPVAKEDLALVVDESVASSDVAQALAESAGELLESIRLFDVYRGGQIGEGKKSLAFALRLRATDRTLDVEEVNQVREAVIAEAAEKFGAELRS